MLRNAVASPVGELQQTNLEVSQGIPLYRLEFLAGERLKLATARLLAWRYLVFGQPDGQAVLVAEVDDEDDGDSGGRSAAVAGSGEAAMQLLSRLFMAETLASGEDYELRLIEIPEADEEALWLHGSRDLFLDLIRADPVEPENSEHFLRRIQAILEFRNLRENIDANEFGGDA